MIFTAIFFEKADLAKFMAKAKACDFFEAPVWGEVLGMVRFTIAVPESKDFVLGLADMLDGRVEESFCQ